MKNENDILIKSQRIKYEGVGGNSLLFFLLSFCISLQISFFPTGNL